MGIGFVGVVMAAIIADTIDENGKYTKFVIGCQRPSVCFYWKSPKINEGVSPVKAEDPEVDELIEQGVNQEKNLIATFTVIVCNLQIVLLWMSSVISQKRIWVICKPEKPIWLHWKIRCVPLEKRFLHNALY